jgi:dodecin
LKTPQAFQAGHSFLSVQVMDVIKIIEVIATSTISFDDAVKQGVKEASETIPNIDSVYIEDWKVHIKEGEIVSYGVVCKLSFRLPD